MIRFLLLVGLLVAHNAALSEPGAGSMAGEDKTRPGESVRNTSKEDEQPLTKKETNKGMSHAPKSVSDPGAKKGAKTTHDESRPTYKTRAQQEMAKIKAADKHSDNALTKEEARMRMRTPSPADVSDKSDTSKDTPLSVEELENAYESQYQGTRGPRKPPRIFIRKEF